MKVVRSSPLRTGRLYPQKYPVAEGNYTKRKLERQCTYNVTFRRVRESLLPWKSMKCYFWSVCAWLSVRACMSVPGQVGVCMQISACSLANPAVTRMRHVVTSFVAPRSPLYFSTLSHIWCDFRKNVIEYKMCGLIFSTSFV
jgi:hypothetical protein